MEKLFEIELLNNKIDDYEDILSRFSNWKKYKREINLNQLLEDGKKIEFDRRTYDGSNIFSLENTLLFVCDEKVKNILEKQEITNLKFRNL